MRLLSIDETTQKFITNTEEAVSSKPVQKKFNTNEKNAT